jgi:hypothetical protein
MAVRPLLLFVGSVDSQVSLAYRPALFETWNRRGFRCLPSSCQSRIERRAARRSSGGRIWWLPRRIGRVRIASSPIGLRMLTRRGGVEWYLHLSASFLSARAAKLLVLAGQERLDRELMVGQM